MANKVERTVRVKMREGLTMPLPSDVVRNSSTFICTPETPIEVLLDHRFTRKRLEAGDFVLVDEDPSKLGLPESRFPHAPYREAAPNTGVDLVTGTVEEPAPAPEQAPPEPEPVREPVVPPPEEPPPTGESGFLSSLFHRKDS